MSLEWLLTPVSSVPPCGLDLDAIDDPEFLEYYFDALGRVPEKYIKPGMEGGKGRITDDWVFDPKSIDIKSESAKIEALLQRSRDVRLMTLWAQFECLAGRPAGLADVLDALAATMEVFGADLHPVIDESMVARREALQDLTQPISMVTGLRMMGLVGSATVTLRKLQVADGRFSPHSGELDLSAQALRASLAGAENRKAVNDMLSYAVHMTESLHRIAAACSMGAHPFSPNFSSTLEVLNEMRAEIVSARPDLRGMDDAPAIEMAIAQVGVTDAAAPAPRPQTALKNHAEARQALIACEVYFERNEPSSASMLLIRQARHLIGQPLIAALEALLPDQSASASVSFGPQTGFVIPAARLKALSDEGLPSGVADAQPPDTVSAPPTISNTSDVAGVLRSVEDFFHARERSSPVPILLQRARAYLDKNFQEIVDELIPKQG